MTTAADVELFDSEKYKVPFPKADGREVTDFILRLGGSLSLSRNDPKWAGLMESLTLGKHVVLEVSATVDGKGNAFRFNEKDETEQVVHTVALKLHSVEPVDAEA